MTDAQIIQFRIPERTLTPAPAGDWRSRRDARFASIQDRAREAEHNPDLTDSCRNQRLRLGRREAWWQAGRLTDFQRARMDWHSALACAQSWNVPGAKLYPECKDNDAGRGEEVSRWRAALMAQMLTPAPTVGDVEWKRTQLRGGQHKFTDIPEKKLQAAIDADVAWLRAHPTRKSIAASRQSNSETMARRREFKLAMRQRIKDVAASRDLSAEDIKGVMTLKHREIVPFTEKHGVNLEWLLEGKGRVFEKGPTLNSEMTAAELTAVVRTLPEAQQRTIEAAVDRLLQERNQ